MGADPKVKHVPRITMLRIGQLVYINGELHVYGEYVTNESPQLIFRKLSMLELGAVEALLHNNPNRTVTWEDIREVLTA